MNRTLKSFAATGAAILMLSGATAMQANAAYLGYGNGDPGDWSLWQEQNGGQSATKPQHFASAHHQHHAAKHNAEKQNATKPAETHYQYEKS